jgi:pyrimidine operon attenuation protein / uracil phosphoribosyltransferase
MTAQSQILGPDEFARTLRRLGHEIVESNEGAENLLMVGLLTRGVPIARRLAAVISEFEHADVPSGTLDIGLYRDDITSRREPPTIRPSALPANVEGATVVLCDDVLYTGRTIRAALNALMDFGRPARVRLAVVVDRGHRELPIRPDFVGKNIPTAANEDVQVRLKEVDGEDGIFVIQRESARA